MTQLSKCCGAEMRIEGDTTKFYVCKKCENACDPAVGLPWEERFAEFTTGKGWEADKDMHLVLASVDSIKHFISGEIEKAKIEQIKKDADIVNQRTGSYTKLVEKILLQLNQK